MDFNRKLMTLQQVLEFTNVKAKSTIYEWMKKDMFPKSINIGSRCVRWRTDEVLKWEAALN